MNKQPIRRRRGLALAAAVAALVALPGVGQAMATPAPPDERVLERQGRIDHQAAARPAGEQGRVALPPRLSSEDRAAAQAGTPRRFIRPEPPMAPGPQLGEQQVAPAPTAAVPAGDRTGPVVVVVVGALLLTVGAATAWRVRHRRPQPESTA